MAESSTPTWKDTLHGRMSETIEREIDAFENEILLRKRGKIDEKVFAETRLRRGAYGQRYDNGQRHDGTDTQKIPFPSGALTKGPDTMWDAPGMQRIKIPMGVLSLEQMEELAAVAEEYSDDILHVTTRQDIQLHFVHIEDTPSIMRRLATVGITTREACGNTIRNVTACPYSGVCTDEKFDVTPYAHATAWHLLGHPQTQDFGRKFKIAFSGCDENPCALTALHDFGAIAVEKDGRRGFALYVGGGLGPVPQQAKLYEAFVPEEEIIPLALAVGRVFANLGERKNRQRARLKFVIQKIGIEEFKKHVAEERAKLTPDARWTAYLDEARSGESSKRIDGPLRPPGVLPTGPTTTAAFEAWAKSNLRPQRQAGYAVATVRLPLGDLTSRQMRGLVDLARQFTGATVRTTVEQNLVFRWLSLADASAFHAALETLGLAEGGASTVSDITACPGTDTCKLGISSSRGLAAELSHRLDARRKAGALDPAVAGLHIKTSGCHNSCGQHHIADLGFLGVSRNVGGRRVPHFQVVLGGEETGNARSYGLPIGAVPSKRIPELVDRLTARFVAERQEGERFQGYIKRIGKAALREMVNDLLTVPPYELEPSFYSDWGDPREYSIGDLGTGECAGEVISVAQFGLAASEREAFEAQLHLEKGEAAVAAEKAFAAMLSAARALVKVQKVEVADDAEATVRAFRERLHDTKLFHDPFAGDKFAHYFFRAAEAHNAATAAAGPAGGVTVEVAHQRIEEAQLFIEAAHACYDRLQRAS